MDIYYTKDHEWVRVEGRSGIMGISAYAVKQLGDITYVELPETGKEITKGDVVCTVESVKAASDIYAPVTAKITEVNSALENAPEKMNESPEEEGWIAKLEISDPDSVNGLMTGEKYDEFVKSLE
ncbi:MAG: glycine cleavage system protein GcvH [Candidatus Omnitrophota bacterium]|nr:glycine cleavage system protein GcvH [Candidatus Omnitrophota bacterium]MBU2528125.1 glycine cleavage system protein GcvH [bacterium]MBU3929503.1 glycine cleavage system protein GcvH [bacterium]MBU4122714.1 glycine cleavage system protein GcvH [bacterium]